MSAVENYDWLPPPRPPEQRQFGSPIGFGASKPTNALRAPVLDGGYNGLHYERNWSMTQEGGDDIQQSASRASPSRAAALASVGSVFVAAAGIVGQIVDSGSVAFAMVAAFGLAALAAIVLSHQRRLDSDRHH